MECLAMDCKKIRPFDLVFFSSPTLHGDLISLGELIGRGKYEWTHVGLVMTKRWMNDIENVEDEDELVIWESLMGDGLPDIESNRIIYGVQFRKLYDVLVECKIDRTRVAWAQLFNNPIDQKEGETKEEYTIRLEELKEKLTYLHHDHFHRMYDWNPIDLLAAPLPIFRPLRKIFGWSWAVFCSKFVAVIYEYLDILDKRIDPGNFTPQGLADYTFPDGSLRHLVSIPHYLN